MQGVAGHLFIRMNHSQFFGKSTEYLVSSMLLSEKRELYLPAVDDHGVDMIVRTKNFDPQCDNNDPNHYEFQEIQVKSISEGGLFAAITCNNPRSNYWFLFYIKNIDRMWLVNSFDFCRLGSRNSKGKNIGKYSFDLTPTKREPIKKKEFLITDFSQLP